jgi:Holliday junction resolvase RusA-like endonuclease
MSERVRKSFGQCHFHNGSALNYNENEPYKIDYSRRFYLFDIVPISAPRMTQSDRWRVNPEHPDINKRQREVVTKYFAYKNELIRQAKQLNFEINSVFEVVFIIPMPNSWSEKKKQKMNGLPCQVKPDTDNLTKAIKDTFCENDSYIWKESAEKRWGHLGSIIIFQ